MVTRMSFVIETIDSEGDHSVVAPRLRPSSLLIIISSSSSPAGRKETAWHRLRQHSVPESCFVLETWGWFQHFVSQKGMKIETVLWQLNVIRKSKMMSHDQK